MRRTLITLLVCLALLLPSALHVLRASQAIASGPLYDLPLFVNAAIRHERGEPVYERTADLQDRYKPGAMVFKFPPPYLFMFLPWFDASGEWPAQFNGIWATVSGLLLLAAVLMGCALVFQAAGEAWALHQRLLFAAVAVSATGWFVPYLHVLGATSAENAIHCLAVLAMLLLRTRLAWLAGVLIGWLACMKLYPAFLLLYPLLLRQWRVLMVAGLTVGAIAGLSVVVFGIEENRFYLTRVLPILLSEPVAEDWTHALKHASGNHGIVAVLVSHGWLPNRHAEWLNAIRLPLLATLVLLVWRLRGQGTAGWAGVLAPALLVTTMMTCLPNLYYPYYTVLLFPLVVLAGYLACQRHWVTLLLLALPMSAWWINDAWTVALATQRGLVEPSAAVVSEVERVGMWWYLFRDHPLLWLVMVGGRLVPFLPYVLWAALAVSLWRLTEPRGRTASATG